MFRLVPRHNINLGRNEMLALLLHVLGDGDNSADEARRFEDAFAAYHGRHYAIALTSGRAALYAILSALNIPDGSEILVPAYSFYTIPEVVRAAGFVPVFVPCDPGHYAMNPDKIKSRMTTKTRALIVEHPFGQPAPMTEIGKIAKRHGLHLIEDPSQSIGAELNGRKVGAFGDAACFSFVHGKNLMTFGGGMLLTDDNDLYVRVINQVADVQPVPLGRVKKTVAGGLVQWLLSTKPGFALGPFVPFYLLNVLDRKRLDGLFVEVPQPYLPESLKPLSNVQSALGRLQLDQLDMRNAARRRNAEIILSGLSDLPRIVLPELVEGATGTFNALAVRVSDGLVFQRVLMLSGVDTRADYMTCFDDCENWERLGDVVYLPCHPGMSERDALYVVAIVRKALGD
jgi:dTDP-4-amino-4,6-dideoxygalactose transaminase